MLSQCKTLREYLLKYGELLGEQAQQALDPLHVPMRDPLPDFSVFGRQPLPAQAHVVAASIKTLARQFALWLGAEMGTGKSCMSVMTIHLYAQNETGRHLPPRLPGGTRPYRVLVFCPGHICEKWAREIRETIPGAQVTILESYSDLVAMVPPVTMRPIRAKTDAERDREKREGPRLVPSREPTPPEGIEWYIIGRDRAKFGPVWEGAGYWRKHKRRLRENKATKQPEYYHPETPRCPRCGTMITDHKGTAATQDYLDRAQRVCTGHVADHAGDRKKPCGEQLWDSYGVRGRRRGLDRVAPARFIQRHMKGYFRFLIVDEAHEEKSEESAQANAAGALMASVHKCIMATGTMIGGRADHIRPLLFRACPASLRLEGLTWDAAMAFNRKYGRIQKTVWETSGGQSTSNRSSMGRVSVRRSEDVKPGIMPTLFGRHLLGNACYLSLDQVSDALPPLVEAIIPVDMDDDQAAEYNRVAEALVEANKALVQTGNRCLLAAMLQTTLIYPDMLFDWRPVGYWYPPGVPKALKTFIPVVEPKDLGRALRPKEKALIELVKKEVAEGRQCWVYVQNTGEHDVQARCAQVLEDAGLRVGLLRAKDVKVKDRERWITAQGRSVDVMISHPKPVETGLDLFSKHRGGHNYVTMIYHQTGYNLFTLRQSSRRSWRIAQKYECRVFYLYYKGTAQSEAMALMGRKMQAAQALEGELSVEGLAAMGGEEVSEAMALARALEENIRDDPALSWARVASVGDDRPAIAGRVGIEDDDYEQPEEEEQTLPRGKVARPSKVSEVLEALKQGKPLPSAAEANGKVAKLSKVGEVLAAMEALKQGKAAASGKGAPVVSQLGKIIKLKF